MKKLILLIAAPILIIAGGCRKNLTEINVNPKAPSDVSAVSLFTNAQRTLMNTLASSNVNLNIFRLIMQQWTETTYTDESNYDLATRSIPRSVWNALYRDVLKDFEESKRLVPLDNTTSAAQKQNQTALAEIMEVYTWYYLVTTFGNIPYTEALDISKPAPKYDDAAAIYSALLTRLDGAISKLAAGASFGDGDILYGGNITAWKKFANSIKLKMGMAIADVDAAKAKSTVESAVTAGVFTSNADNAIYGYLSAPPNTNPIWVDLVQSGRKDFVVTNTVVNKLKALNDPRIPLFFTEDAVGDYSGGVPGASNNYATFSKPSDAITAPDFPGDLLDYSEVEFLLAEAVERGFAVGGTAATHYNNAITASITFWGGTAADAATYLAQPSVAYATAAGTYKQKIGEQAWIALFNRGWDAWTEWRRLDYPVITAPASALTATPIRYTYSVDEQNVNTANYNSASTAIGGDKVTTKLWFDKF